LPVAADFVCLPFPEAKGVDRNVELAQLLFQRRDGAGKRFRLLVHVDEDKSAPCLAAHAEKSELARIETFGRAEIPCVGKPAVQRVTPAMVTADECALAASLAVFGKRPGAVAADVVERPECAVFAPDNDQGKAGDAGCDI